MSDRLQALLDSLSLPRRKLLPAALLGAGSLSTLLSSEVAKADTAFTSFAFNASANGNAAQRTDPDRWADVTNVLDFGADPTGNAGTATATTTAINAAIAVAAAKGTTAQSTVKGGTVFFPSGAYVVNGSIVNTAQASVRIVGAGMWNTKIRGTVTGYVIDATGPFSSGSSITAIEDISVYNDQTSSGFDLTTGAIRIGNVGATSNVLVKNVQFQGWTGICQVFPSAQNDTNFETTFINCSTSGKGGVAWNVIPTVPYVTGPIGFYVAGCTLICCEASACAVGIFFAGTDTVAIRCRTETSAIGFLTGITPRFDDTVAGASGSGSLVTITSTTPLANFGWLNVGQTQQITVQGVTPSGYNTTQVTGTRTGANTFTYASAFTGAFTSGGTWTQLVSNVNSDANMIMGHSTERCLTAYFLSNFGSSVMQGAIATGTVAPAIVATSISWAATAGGTATVTSATPLANFSVDGNGTPWTSGNPTQPVNITSATVPGYDTGNTFATGTWRSATTFDYPLAVNPGSTATTNISWSFKCQFGIRLKNAGRCTLESIGVGISPISGAGIDLTVNAGATAAHPTLIGVTAGVGGWIMPPGAIKASYQYLNCDQPGGTTLDAAGNVAGMRFADLPGQGGVSLTPAIPGMQYDIVNNANAPAWHDTAAGTGTAFASVRFDGTVWRVMGY